MLRFYYVLLKNGQPIGLDQSYGSYPWLPSHPSEIKYWDNISDAEIYSNTFKNENFKIAKIYLEIREKENE